MTDEEFFKSICTVCGRQRGQCARELLDSHGFNKVGWRTEDGGYTHELPADTKIGVKFVVCLPKNATTRIRRIVAQE